MWEIEAAKAGDMPEIEDLITTVDGDRVDLATDQFAVAKSEDARILGCGRLRPYPEFCELASIAVADDSRTNGIGREIVKRLLANYEGTIYLICDDGVVEFFRRFEFSLLAESDIPHELLPKWEYFSHPPTGSMNLMRRGQS